MTLQTLQLNPTINAVLDHLRASKYCQAIKIFGSIQKGCVCPGDVDLFIDLSAEPERDPYKVLSEYCWLLSLARKYYGFVDPFICLKTGGGSRLFTRNDEATDWKVAKSSRTLLKAGKNGAPLQQIKALPTENK